ncbi:MAG TPA: hypothetical protein VEA44_08560 [Caulobacter sp.]|nr:hypothetical protein [Caulobacter sp.]
MRLAIILAGLALCGFAAPRLVDSWNNGPKTPAYHRVLADCETLTHSHGRNAVNGRWVMPLSSAQIAVADKRLTVTCQDGSACIRAGRMKDLPGRLASHDIPFDSPADAAAMAAALEALQQACKG